MCLVGEEDDPTMPAKKLSDGTIGLDKIFQESFLS
jgi:hypothetical protein